MGRKFIQIIFGLLFFISTLGAMEEYKVISPDGNICFLLKLDGGTARYEVNYDDEKIILPSSIGFKFNNQPELSVFSCTGCKKNSFREVWKPIWGQSKSILNEYNEILLSLEETKSPWRKIEIIVRAYNDGVAFRYHFNEQKENNYFEITDEITNFTFADDFSAWWIPNDYDSEEYTYRNTKLDKMIGVHTPVTLQTKRGTCVVIHEAELKDYAGMTLEKNGYPQYSYHSVLVPWPDELE
jgi:alpha-glucosidase